MRKPPAEAAQPDYALVGLVRKAQGVRGEVLIEPLTDSPDVIFAPGNRVFGGDASGELPNFPEANGGSDGHKPPTLTVRALRHHKGGLLIKFAEIGDRNSAEIWRGRYLLAPFAELPPPKEDEVYLHDLIGMVVENEEGARVGQVTTYYELPQGIMLDVMTAKGSALIPYRSEIVHRTDLERRVIVFNDKTGLLD